MTKIVIAALLTLAAACTQDVSELGRPCATDDPCEQGLLQCVTYAEHVGEQAAMCTTACASPTANGTGPCNAAGGICDTDLVVGEDGAAREHTWCVPTCEDLGAGAIECPYGLYPRVKDYGCVCLP